MVDYKDALYHGLNNDQVKVLFSDVSEIQSQIPIVHQIPTVKPPTVNLSHTHTENAGGGGVAVFTLK